MGLRDRIKDTLRRAVAPQPAKPAPPPPARPVPHYRDAARVAELVEPQVQAPKPEPVLEPEPMAPVQPAPAVELRFKVRFVNEDEGLDAVIEVGPGELVLEAGERAGLALPYSCRSGGCTSCMGKLVSGELIMGEQYTLEPEQVEAGYRLLCCAEATCDVVVITHQCEELT